MRYFRFALIITVLVSSINAYCEETTVIFKSPNGISNIIYKGEDYRGEGTFYLKEIDKSNVIIKTNIYYGPRINWYGDYFAEIFIPHGSPFNSSFIYDIKSKRLSRLIDNVMNVFPERNLVVFTDWEGFIFADIFKEIILQNEKIDGINGSVMAIRSNFDIHIDDGKIRIGTKVEPFSLKDLKKFKYYEFRKKF
jgi:hypothetical protein